MSCHRNYDYCGYDYDNCYRPRRKHCRPQYEYCYEYDYCY
jgi:hypothetical protein